MEFFRAVLARLEQADASDLIAALALVVATLSFLSSRRTSQRAVNVAQQAIDSRGRLAGARVLTGNENCAARVVNGTDPTVLDQVLLRIESQEGEGVLPRVRRAALMPMDSSFLHGVVGPCPPISLTPFESVEWNLPALNPPRSGGCVHIRIEAADALGRRVVSAESTAGSHRHSRWSPESLTVVGTLNEAVLPLKHDESLLNDLVHRLRSDTGHP